MLVLYLFLTMLIGNILFRFLPQLTGLIWMIASIHYIDKLNSLLLLFLFFVVIALLIPMFYQIVLLSMKMAILGTINS